MPTPLVLVIDDDSGIRKLLSEILNEEGYRVIACADASAEEVAGFAPDLLLLDQYLGPRSGLNLLEAVRRHHQLTALPVVLVTGDYRTVEAEQARIDALAAEVLLKPFDLDEFLTRVCRLCSDEQLIA